MKRKIERYLYSKNIDGKHKLIDADGILLIGDDIDGCVRAARENTAGAVTKSGDKTTEEKSVKIQVGAHPVSSKGPDRKKRKTELNSLFSPAVAPKVSTPTACTPISSAKDREELVEYCRTLRGGYVNGIYRSAIERRKMAQTTTASGQGLTEALNNLNLTPEERERLPSFFKKHVLKNLSEYAAMPAARAKTMRSELKPVHADSTSPKIKPVLQSQQLRPSPMMTKKERDAALNAAFLAFSPQPDFDTNANTPLRSPLRGISPAPGSAFTSFSPFIPINYDDVMMQGMTMTPGIIRSSGEALLAPNSWSRDVFDDTPKADEVEAVLVQSNPGPLLPTADELRSEKKSNDADIDAQLMAVGAGDEHAIHVSSNVQIIVTFAISAPDKLNMYASFLSKESLSFSDVLSPNDETKQAMAVTHSGPLRMRIKSSIRMEEPDLSTHHFDAWQSPDNHMSQPEETKS